MFSKKVEDIPKESYKTFREYLNELKASSTKYVRVEGVVKNTDLAYETAIAALSDLADKDMLDPHIKIRCPDCDQHLDTYKERSEVSDRREICPCGKEFRHSNKDAWDIVYKIKDFDEEFFLDLKPRMKRFVESAKDLPPQYFEDEFENLKDLENPQKRGRYLDYFVGLLFQQLEGVEVILKGGTKSGEVDVYVSCLDSPDWLERLVGSSTMVENKWEENPIGTKEINAFHQKTKENLVISNLAYFMSMNGFTTGSSPEDTGAVHIIREKDDPKLIGLEKSDLKQMISAGNPSEVLRDKQFDN